MNEPKNPPISTGKRPLSRIEWTTLLTFLGIVAGSFTLAYFMVGSFLLPILMGGILSMMLQKYYRRICGEKRSKKVALLLTLGIILLVVLPIAAFVTLGVRQGIEVGKKLSETGISYSDLTEKITHWPVLQSLGFEPEAIASDLQQWAESLGKAILGAVLGIASRLPSIAFQLTLMALSCFFFLVDGPRFLDWARGKIPMDRDVQKRLARSFQDTSDSVIWATLAASGAQALLMFTLFIVLGVPAKLLAAGATFFLAWIPMVGSSPVWILGAFYLLLKGSIVKTIILVISGLSMGIIDNIVRASVLRGRSEMHPLVSLVAIFGGIEMFGVLGVFLGPIIASIVISLLDVWPALGQSLGLLEDSTKAELRHRDL